VSAKIGRSESPFGNSNPAFGGTHPVFPDSKTNIRGSAVA